MKKIIVTTSWDDGDKKDLWLAELLKKYNLKATFYVPQKIDFCFGNKCLVRLSDQEIKTLANDFEIGAHSLNHIYFDQLNDEQIKEEIIGSKQWLETLLGKPVEVFAYPGGVYNQAAIAAVRQAGFLGARTTKNHQIDIKDNFKMGTTSQAYPLWARRNDWSFPFSLKRYSKRMALAKEGFSELGVPFKIPIFWNQLAKRLFDVTLEHGGIFHLNGHSWEIERYNLWGQLEKVLAYIANRDEVEYLTNSEVLKKL